MIAPVTSIYLIR